MKKALITGVTGQDGSYLSELLLDREYEVYGVVRRTSVMNRERVEHLGSHKRAGRFNLVYGDLNDAR
jgi:GDPmannose 4,6-dehydratase